MRARCSWPSAANRLNRHFTTLQIGVTASFRPASPQVLESVCRSSALYTPSGCRSGDGPSFWRIELGDRVYATRVKIPINAIDEDEEEPEEETQ